MIRIVIVVNIVIMTYDCIVITIKTVIMVMLKIAYGLLPLWPWSRRFLTWEVPLSVELVETDALQLHGPAPEPVTSYSRDQHATTQGEFAGGALLACWLHAATVAAPNLWGGERVPPWAPGGKGGRGGLENT